jgi:hypothetical protein
LPDIADYSSTHLELIPKGLFINSKLSVLNLRHNNLLTRPTNEAVFTVGMFLQKGFFFFVLMLFEKRLFSRVSLLIFNFQGDFKILSETFRIRQTL